MRTPYILSTCTWTEVRETEWQVAVLPWGATEAHNTHLPYGTDVIQCDHVAAKSAAYAWAKGAKITVLPTVPFGVNTGQMDIALDLNLMPSTQRLILMDLVASVYRAGIRKMVILNGHGGNDFKPLIREVGTRFPDLLICLINWYQAQPRTPYFESSGDHADELETSVMSYIASEWVRPLSEAMDGRVKKWQVQGLNDGLAWAERRWSRVTESTGVGNPYPATAEKGRRFFEAVTERIGQFLVDLAAMQGWYEGE